MEEKIDVVFPPKKRRRKSVTTDSSDVTPTDTDKVNNSYSNNV